MAKPKKKMGRPPGEETSQVRIAKRVGLMAKRVADYRGMTVADYLTSLTQPLVERDYIKMTKESDGLV